MNELYDRESSMIALQRALPYIRLFKGKVFVVKVGGALVGEPGFLEDLAEQLGVLRELGIRVVVVHGGGPQTTELAGRLGVETAFVDGRRVTGEDALEVAVMTMSGAVNTALLAACRAASLPAVGVSGVDGGLIRARRRPPVKTASGPVDYGLVGDIVSVDTAVLDRLLEGGFVPVVSPLCADDEGQVLNVNADTVAQAVARAMGAGKLVFLTETVGLLEDKKDPGSLVSYTDVQGLADLQSRGCIDAGMLPKVHAAREALVGGVERVHMVGWRVRAGLLREVFTNEGAGTLVVKDTASLLPNEQDPEALGATGSDAS